MPKSADETAEPGNDPSDESDLIELTEEIPAGYSPSKKMAEAPDERPETQPAEDEFDALSREMPEFRVPDQGDDADGSSDPQATSLQDQPTETGDDEEIVELRDTVDSEVDVVAESNEAVPTAAILSGRRSSRKNTAAQAADDEALDTSSGDGEDDQDDEENEESLTETVIIDAQERPSGDDEPADKPRASGDSDPEEPAADETEPAAEEEVGYDRQEMVKTIQMTAIDRKAFERQVQAEQIEEASLLLDHSHAPDVVVFPPRVLTTRWKEGGPLLRAGVVDPPTGEIPVEVEAETVEPETDELALDEPASDGPSPGPSGKNSDKIREYQDTESSDDENSDVEEHGDDSQDSARTLEEEDFPEIEPDAVEIELDSEAIEEAAEIKPPPKPAPQAPKKPDKPAAQAQPKKKGAAKPPKGAKDEDPELSGLVQELLEENKAGRKKKPQKPRSPRETWFQKVFTEEYLRTLPKDIHRQTKREVSFIEESFDLDDSDRVLDLACGFGRHSIELTKRGHEVAGLDLSMPLLQKALNEAKKQSLSIKFIHGDMRELAFEGIFSACFLWQTSFGYFDDQTNFRVLRGIYRALKPGGRLLIEVLNRDHIATEMPHRLWWEGVECVFLEEVELDHRSSVLHTKRSFIYEDGSPPLEQNTYIRIYSLHELCQLLRAAGFAVREVSGELHHRGRFLGSASSRIIVQAQKRPPRGGRK